DRPCRDTAASRGSSALVSSGHPRGGIATAGGRDGRSAGGEPVDGRPVSVVTVGPLVVRWSSGAPWHVVAVMADEKKAFWGAVAGQVRVCGPEGLASRA